MDALEDHGPGVSEDVPILPSGGTWNPLKGLRRGGSLPLVGVRPSSSCWCWGDVDSPHQFWSDVESLHRSKLAFSFASMELEDFLGALCLSVFVFLCFALWTYWTDVMGQTQTTPLSIMIDHFKDVRGRANNLSVEV